ncbi:unnamed protein product [Prorocentrum cordatum]|uniref:TerD domain-containing protein n=1 Tax=Prorocentrum cordatum TaxID=2364126 RepID=A0ABN9PUM2_9DINO|nr:unnamed protein product [Polarella glacialis]
MSKYMTSEAVQKLLDTPLEDLPAYGPRLALPTIEDHERAAEDLELEGIGSTWRRHDPDLLDFEALAATTRVRRTINIDSEHAQVGHDMFVADATVLPNGELNPSPHIHPWALQFSQDLNAALAHPIGEELKEVWQPRTMANFFGNPEVTEAFRYCDFRPQPAHSVRAPAGAPRPGAPPPTFDDLDDTPDLPHRYCDLAKHRLLNLEHHLHKMSGGAAAAATGSFQASGNSGGDSKPPGPKKGRKGDKDRDTAMDDAKGELQKILDGKDYRKQVQTAREAGPDQLRAVGSPTASLAVTLLEKLATCDVGGVSRQQLNDYLDKIEPTTGEPTITREQVELDVQAIKIEQPHDESKACVLDQSTGTERACDSSPNQCITPVSRGSALEYCPSGEAAGKGTGCDGITWVQLDRLPRQVVLLLFVMAVHQPSKSADAANRTIHLFEGSASKRVGRYPVSHRAPEACAVAVMKRAGGGRWKMLAIQEAARVGRHFLEVVEPVLGKVVHDLLPSLTRRQKVMVSMAMEKGSVADLPLPQAARALFVGVSWDLGRVGHAASLVVSAVLLGAGAKELGAVTAEAPRAEGVRHCGSSAGVASSGFSLEQAAVPEGVEQIFVVCHVRRDGHSSSGDPIQKPDCCVVDPRGCELARFAAAEALREGGLLLARLFRVPGRGRWGFQALGDACGGASWRDCLGEVHAVCARRPQDLQQCAPDASTNSSEVKRSIVSL